jgi:DNA-binding beta-propeller fold protein YncE
MTVAFARLPLLALLALVALPDSAAAAQSTAFVVTTDFSTGSLSAVNLGTRAVAKDVASVHSDAVGRWSGGLLYVVNRFGQDNVQVIDPAQGYATVRQFSTGNGSNPHDICFVSASKAYVTRYELGDLLVVNPSTGATLGTISLAGFADADGIPEMDRMVRVANRVFVALQRLDRNAGFQPTDRSLVAVIDAGADTVLDADPATPGKQAILLAGKNPVTTFAFDRATSRLLLGCAGRYGVLDGGIEYLDPVSMTSLGTAIGETALGGDVSDLAWNGPAHSYAIVSDASFNTLLVSWSALTGQKLATVYAPGGFSLSDCELDDRGELYVCNNNLFAPGLYVFRATADTLLAGPLDCGLPPYQVTFDAPSDQVLAVEPGGATLSISAPWPNPARDAASVTVALTRGGTVGVDAFDVGGRCVRHVLARELPAGRSVVQWDLRDGSGRALPAGVYLLRVEFRGQTLARRLAIVR